MSVLTSIKTYFTKKANQQPTGDAPEGVCPNCWGKQEWEGEFYEIQKGDSLQKRDELYNNFINKIVESNIDGITLRKDTYTCTTCEMSFK